MIHPLKRAFAAHACFVVLAVAAVTACRQPVAHGSARVGDATTDALRPEARLLSAGPAEGEHLVRLRFPTPAEPRGLNILSEQRAEARQRRRYYLGYAVGDELLLATDRDTVAPTWWHYEPTYGIGGYDYVLAGFAAGASSARALLVGGRDPGGAPATVLPLVTPTP